MITYETVVLNFLYVDFGCLSNIIYNRRMLKYLPSDLGTMV